MAEEISGTAVQYCMTQESIASYLQHEQDRKASENLLRRGRRAITCLYEWLPEDKTITKQSLLLWRQHMTDLGYASDTQRGYVKEINRYLNYIGCSALRFQQGRAKDISGQQFGYLTAIETTGEKNRRDYVWRCRCKCGKEAFYPATRLLTGNTVSCGCLRAEHLRTVNKYIDGTSLRQALDEQVISKRAASGYTGVTIKRGKWKAYIKYKGQTTVLGCYDKLEDAVKARARGKELVQMDALGLLNFYEQLHKDDEPLPEHTQSRQQPQPEMTQRKNSRALRSNNTSGCPGVSRKRDKWTAKITHQGKTYQIGCFASLEAATAARKAAEQRLRAAPADFPRWILTQRENRKRESA